MLPNTDLLYQHDAYRTSFEARIVARRTVKDSPGVILDATCFYPTSGGQPNDLGTLNGIAVRDVKKDDGDIVHILAEPIDADVVKGVIDWPRRYDHMQQHTGQHILSRVMVDLFEAQTLSFHISGDICTIDIDRKPESADDWELLQDRLHEIVGWNVSVNAYTVQPDEVDALNIRKIPDRDGPLRIIDIEGVDRTACGGTHCATSGELGVVQITNRRPRKVHGGLYRIEFMCGRRALYDYNKKIDLVREVADVLSVSERDLRKSVSMLMQEKKSSDKAAAVFRGQLLDYEANVLIASIDVTHDMPLLHRVFEGRTQDELRILAQKIISQTSCAVLFGSITGKPLLVFARSDEIQMHMGELMREATALVGGRGGGKPNMAMGGGQNADVIQRALAYAVEKIRSE